VAKSKSKQTEVKAEAEQPSDFAVSMPPSSLPTPAKAAPRAEPATDWSGAALRKAREAAGLTLKEISERTKVSVPILTALEEEAFASMPNARVYVRGFVRCLARELTLDQDAVSKSYLPRWERWDAKRRG
jgi:hypothetical protein